MNMRTYLSELGCLPVSAMIHVPRAQEVLEEDGGFAEGVDAARWRGNFGRTIAQFLWWAAAEQAQRERGQPTQTFDRDPSQRNAP